MNFESPVGVFDSGVGGISVLKRLVQELPNESFIYYGDTAHAPYGTRNVDDIMHCVNEVVDYLLRQDIKALVIACNTASAVAAQTLRSWMQIPVIAMEPALKPAALLRKQGRILVLATPVTLKLEKFQKLYELWGEGAVPVPCPGLMELVEKEDFAGAETYLRGVFSTYDPDSLDAIVLGCTHYVFLKSLIRSMLPQHVFVVDGNEGTARQLKHILEEKRLCSSGGRGTVKLYTSGDAHDIEVMKQLYAYDI